MTTPTLAQALQRRVFDQQLACRSHGNCFVACALHDFWCQVAIAALCAYYGVTTEEAAQWIEII